VEQPTIFLRRAVLADSSDIFRISNDSDVRASSFQSELITLEKHNPWFERHIDDSLRPFYVLIADGAVAGQVRFDSQDTRVRLSYSLAPEFRGKGLGSVLVAAGCVAARLSLGECDIYATTLRENVRSHRVLSRVGFQKRNETGDDVNYVLEFRTPIFGACPLQ
jgi:spore coat polysaccharide biosynthesis protein SpsF